MDTITTLTTEKIPEALLQIPQPPNKLYIRGKLPSNDYIYLAIVGSRRNTSYGKDICQKLIEGLRGFPVVIVSGLAMGIDSIAHATAIKNNILTIAFPGSGLDDNVLYPRSNLGLAKEILDSGGCLISEFEPDFKAQLYSFPRRNRLMAGMSKAVLIIEAEEKSGTLITARMALDYNRDVLAIPGSVFSDNAKGTNELIRKGATPITCVDDLLEALGFDTNKENENNEDKYTSCSPNEKKIIELLHEPMERDDLIRESGLSISEANALLSIMEIKDLIREEMGEVRKN